VIGLKTGMLHSDRVIVSANVSSNDIFVVGLCDMMQKIENR